MASRVSTLHAIGIFDANILEKRVMMMNIKKQPLSSVLKYGLIIPSTLFLLSIAAGGAAMAVVIEPQSSSQAADQAQPSAIVIDGHTAQIAASNQVNTLDLAANEAPPMESTLPPGDRADSAVTTAAPTAAFVAPTPADANRNNGDRNARAQSVSRDMSRDTDEDASADANQDSSAVSAPSGLAQILAALGGAATAAVIAWFLIGSMGTYAARSVAVTRPPARRRPPSAT